MISNVPLLPFSPRLWNLTLCLMASGRYRTCLGVLVQFVEFDFHGGFV